jgi:hypothetical protein
LAESWGDAGDVLIKDSWIFKNQQENFNSFIMVQELHYNDVYDEKDTTVDRSVYYCLLDLTREGDTISTDQNQLSKKFAK